MKVGCLIGRKNVNIYKSIGFILFQDLYEMLDFIEHFNVYLMCKCLSSIYMYVCIFDGDFCLYIQLFDVNMLVFC